MKCNFYNICKIREMKMDSWDDYAKWKIERSKMPKELAIQLEKIAWGIKESNLYINIQKVLNNENKLTHYKHTAETLQKVLEGLTKYFINTYKEDVYECLKTQMTRNRG